MPNQRDSEKKKLSTWMFERDLEELKEAARKRGLPVNDFITQLVRDLDRRNERAARLNRGDDSSNKPKGSN